MAGRSSAAATFALHDCWKDGWMNGCACLLVAVERIEDREFEFGRRLRRRGFLGRSIFFALRLRASRRTTEDLFIRPPKARTVLTKGCAPRPTPLGAARPPPRKSLTQPCPAPSEAPVEGPGRGRVRSTDRASPDPSYPRTHHDAIAPIAHRRGLGSSSRMTGTYGSTYIRT